jgi:hypothetical protein
MTRIFTYAEVEKEYRNITARMIQDACAKTDGPRKFRDGLVSEHEIDAWIRREEAKKGVREKSK